MKSFFPFIIIVICVGTYFGYIQPAASEVKSLSREKTGYDNILSKTRELAEKREDILTIYNSISESDVDRLNKIIPDTFSPIIFLNDLTAQVSQFGMNVRDFRTSEPKAENRDDIVSQSKGQFYKTTVVNFSVSGPYSEFLKLLSSLESSLRLVDVVGITIRANYRSTSENSLDYALELETYSLR